MAARLGRNDVEEKGDGDGGRGASGRFLAGRAELQQHVAEREQQRGAVAATRGEQRRHGEVSGTGEKGNARGSSAFIAPGVPCWDWSGTSTARPQRGVADGGSSGSSTIAAAAAGCGQEGKRQRRGRGGDAAGFMARRALAGARLSTAATTDAGDGRDDTKAMGGQRDATHSARNGSVGRLGQSGRTGSRPSGREEERKRSGPGRPRLWIQPKTEKKKKERKERKGKRKGPG